MTVTERNVFLSVRPFLPQEPGLRAHVGRVAILARRAAAHGNCSSEETELAMLAGLLHHHETDEADGAVKLWAAMGLQTGADGPKLPPKARGALQTLRHPEENDCAWALLVEAANLFDEQMENLPYDELSTEAAVQDLWLSGMIPDAFADALASFRVVSQGQLKAALAELPPLDLSADPREILRAWLPLEEQGELRSHCLNVAGSALAAARESKEAHPSDAFFAGLLHDAGRAAYRELDVMRALKSWEDGGFPLTYAEFLISGTDHAALGTSRLRADGLSEAIAEAVEFHHRPELTDSRLAALLYLAEDVDEGLPSCARDHLSAKRLSLPATSQARAAGRN